MTWQRRRRVRKYHLKRTVHVRLSQGPGLDPAVTPSRWQAMVVRGPKRAMFLATGANSRWAAVQALLRLLQGMGYSGTAKLMEG